MEMSPVKIKNSICREEKWRIKKKAKNHKSKLNGNCAKVFKPNLVVKRTSQQNGKSNMKHTSWPEVGNCQLVTAFETESKLLQINADKCGHNAANKVFLKKILFLLLNSDSA